MKNQEHQHKWSNIIYYVASFLMPSILLFDLYNRNHIDSHIIYVHVLILAGILGTVGVLLLVVYNFVIKSIEGALTLSLLSWLAFWLYEWLLEMVRGVLPMQLLRSRYFIILVIIIIALVTFIFRRFKPSFYVIRPAFNILAFCIIVMFIYNFALGFNNEMTLVRARANAVQLQAEESVYLKRDFYIDPSLPNPDIYWFHLDGLMSIETVEQFWGLNYDHYRKEFEARGFAIYEEATLAAGNTEFAWAALLSPAFYDSYLGERIAKVEPYLHIQRTGFGTTRTGFLRNELARVGLDVTEDIEPNPELFRALFDRGYNLCVRGTYHSELVVSFEHFTDGYIPRRDMWRDFTRSALPTLLTLTTPLPLVEYERRDDDSNRLTHLEGIEPVANFVFQLNYDAHFSMSVKYLMPETEDDVAYYKRYGLYPSLGFEVAIERTLEMIDEILEGNPNAVIVLQADHGIHIFAVQRYMLESGYSEEQIAKLMNSVFSAVRIPKVYGGLQEPVHPLNITRVLVNRFVGKNYEFVMY